jgi:hypothetical protein
MADYDLSTQSGRADARAAGNWVGTDSSGNVVMEAGHPGGQAGAPAGNTAAPATPTAAGSPDLSSYVAAMQASSGITIKQLDEQKREFDATLAEKEQEFQQQGLPQLAINKQLADLEQAKLDQLTQAAVFSQNLQTAQLALDDRIRSGTLSVAQAQQDLADRIQSGQLKVSQDQQALAREIQTGQLAVSQGQLGLDTLKTAASLSGPANWIQAANFARGVSANTVLPGFVSNLLSGQATGMGAPTASGATPSVPATLQTLAAPMGVATQPQTAATTQYMQQAPGAVPTTAPSVAQIGTPDKSGVPAATAAALPAYAQTQAQYMAQTPGAFPTTSPSVAQIGTPNKSGFTTHTAAGDVYTPSATEQAAAGSATSDSTGLDAAHMANFYANAVKSANTGGSTSPTGEVVTPQSSSSDPNAYATAADVAAAFGRPAPAAPAAGGDQNAQSQAALSKLFSQGGQSLGPQALEGLSPTETQIMQGGGAALGYDVPGYVSAYQNSRIGQKSAAPASVAMAGGGIVTRPTVALIGEKGPEAVVPLTPQLSGYGTPWDGVSGAQPPPPQTGPQQTTTPPVPNPAWDGYSDAQAPQRMGPVDPVANLNPFEQKLVRFLAQLAPSIR